jgi:hypothetical protein
MKVKIIYTNVYYFYNIYPSNYVYISAQIRDVCIYTAINRFIYAITLKSLDISSLTLLEVLILLITATTTTLTIALAYIFLPIR